MLFRNFNFPNNVQKTSGKLKQISFSITTQGYKKNDIIILIKIEMLL